MLTLLKSQLNFLLVAELFACWNKVTMLKCKNTCPTNFKHCEILGQVFH